MLAQEAVKEESEKGEGRRRENGLTSRL